MKIEEGISGIKRSFAAVTTLALAMFACLLLAPAPGSAALPSNFERHSETYWVWYGPGSWFASSGKNDLNIASPTGQLWEKYGAGGPG
ncbi:MAG: hypothetical protein JJE13_12600 [Thermoleophilia bacterium]|nr:hypothetical protein [Thermoleophilia bacterium]